MPQLCYLLFHYINDKSKRCITKWLLLSPSLNTAISINVVGKPLRLQGDMGTLLIKLPNLGYCSPLQKINNMDKCLWYFYPSYGSGSRKITAESRKMYSYPC